jgi:protein PhnA
MLVALSSPLGVHARKRGTVIKNIHLTDNKDEIEGRTDKVKSLVLRTEFLKKA